MGFRDVETLFHEFGHALQHMLTQQSDTAVAGINGIEWDAVELPSQFMENFCYTRAVMDTISEHVETGASLPQDLFDKVVAARQFRAGSLMCRQLHFALTDLKLHSTYACDAGRSGVSAFDVEKAVAQETAVLPPLPHDRFLCSFMHIFAGGYSAGYYSYKWAEVLSADAYAAFEEAGLEDEAALKATGRRFRDTVLALGGGRHPSDVFRDFRGRAPDVEPLLRHSGLL